MSTPRFIWQNLQCTTHGLKIKLLQAGRGKKIILKIQRRIQTELLPIMQKFENFKFDFKQSEFYQSWKSMKN